MIWLESVTEKVTGNTQPSACVDVLPRCCSNYNPGQNVLGHLRKLGTKTHFAKLTHILPLKKAWGCCYKGLFLLSPSPPSSVDCVELKLECITSTLHRGGRGEGRCLNLTSYCVSVPRVLTRVVAFDEKSNIWLQLFSVLINCMFSVEYEYSD